MATASGMSAIPVGGAVFAAGWRSSGQLARDLRFDHDAVLEYLRQVRRRDHLRRSDRPRRPAGGGAPQHQAVFPRDAVESADRGSGHRCGGRHRPQRRRALGGRQLLLFAGAAAADPLRRRHRRAFGHQAYRRPGRVLGGAVASTTSSWARYSPSCARPVRRCRRSTPGYCSRAWRRWGCAWSGTPPAHWPLAEFLESHPAVARVYHPALKSHPQYEIAQRQQSGRRHRVLRAEGRYAGAAARQCRRVIDSTRLCSITGNRAIRAPR